MSTKITYKLELAVEKGPNFTVTRDLAVEAYDHLRVDVPAGDNATPGTVTVDVQPGASDQLRVLSITSTLYSELITFKVDTAGADIKLDAPHLYVGGGALSLLGADPKKFVFLNKAGADKPAVVHILVGRKAST
jgi:hypothetical protein